MFRNDRVRDGTALPAKRVLVGRELRAAPTRGAGRRIVSRFDRRAADRASLGIDQREHRIVEPINRSCAGAEHRFRNQSGHPVRVAADYVTCCADRCARATPRRPIIARAQSGPDSGCRDEPMALLPDASPE